MTKSKLRIAKMDKKDLEHGISKVSEMLKNNDANSIINDIKKNK